MKNSWRRFSLRTLLGAITATCLLLGSWSLTNTWGRRDLAEHIRSQLESKVIPEILPDGRRRIPGMGAVVTAEFIFFLRADTVVGHDWKTQYYVWVFGYKRHLPKYDRTGFLPDAMFGILPAEDG
jgi:hypothetical protein